MNSSTCDLTMNQSAEMQCVYGPSVAYRVSEIVILVMTTAALLALYVTSVLSSFPKAGFKNSTGKMSNKYYTQITPAGWTFAVWSLIYLLQAVWIIYGWSFVFRPSIPRTISLATYIFFTIGNLSGVVWLYVWGNGYPRVAFGVIVVYVVALYATLVAQCVYLHVQTPALTTHVVDLYITRTVVLNSIALYAAWLTVATQLNFVIVLQYFSRVNGTTAGTVGLSVLLIEIVIYFILENTALDWFVRYVLIVYPLFIWAFSGVLSAHWRVESDRRNAIFTLVLLVLSIVLLLIRIILWIVFIFVRPLVVPVRPATVM